MNSFYIKNTNNDSTQIQNIIHNSGKTVNEYLVYIFTNVRYLYERMYEVKFVLKTQGYRTYENVNITNTFNSWRKEKLTRTEQIYDDRVFFLRMIKLNDINKGTGY